MPPKVRGSLFGKAKICAPQSRSTISDAAVARGFELLVAELKIHEVSSAATHKLAEDLQTIALGNAKGLQRDYATSIRRVVHHLKQLRLDGGSLTTTDDDLARSIWDQSVKSCRSDESSRSAAVAVGICLRDSVVAISPPMASDMGKVCLIVRDVLSSEQCQALVAHCDQAGWNPASLEYGLGSGDSAGDSVVDVNLRDSDRCMVYDAGLAAAVWERLKCVVPANAFAQLSAFGVNDCFRCLRYSVGQAGFAKHVDGHCVVGGAVSRITVQIYLNEGFQGGATRLCHVDDSKDVCSGIDIVPETGMALVFDQQILHKGCPVEFGTKYSARTEIMYRGRDDSS